MNSFSTEPREIRKFGLIALMFFGTLAGIALWRDKYLIGYFFGALAGFGLGFLILPGPLTPAYRMWLSVAHGIGRVITTIILTIAYYGVITPAGLAKRFFGGRPISLTSDPSVTSYWKDREEPVQPKEQFSKRY